MSEHYFSADPSVRDQPRTVTFTAYGRSYELASSTGVFSGDRLDLGTSVLLREAPLPSSGTFLDLGCGYGPLASVLSTQVPDAVVWAVDVNARALELTRANAARLGVTVHAVAPDDVPAELRFDQIWSNPPIRIGKAALHELLLRWLPRLEPGGSAWLVVAKNLGADSLQRWLIEQGFPTSREASAKGFRILRIHNQRALP
jgi:16S rRNA (guanine1207-N2)-methyltransferase